MSGYSGKRNRSLIAVELSLSHQQELILGFIEEVRQTFRAECSFFDFSIHAKPNNPHAHICMSEREQLSPFNFSRTKRRDWDGQEFIKQCRFMWERHTNTALEAAGVGQRVDCRSHADRGLSVLPSLHEGKAAYFNSEVKNMNQQIKQVNEMIKNKREVNPTIPSSPKVPVPSKIKSTPPQFDESAEWAIQTDFRYQNQFQL